MIQFVSKETNKKYKREVEGMGKGLVLLHLENINKNNGYNFHLFYRNGKKPPLDIGICPKDNNIEYISFFIQDETVATTKNTPEIFYEKNGLKIFSKKFSLDNLSVNFEKDFDILFCDDSLIIVEKNITQKLIAYFISENEYILINENKEVSGFIFKSISQQELAILKASKVI